MEKVFTFIRSIFLIPLAIAIFILFWLIGLGLRNILINIFDTFDLRELIIGVEYLFISPLPLLIILALYNYFNIVVRNSILETADAPVIRNKFSTVAMNELSVAKYFFTSILTSTVFVIILEFFITIRERVLSEKGAMGLNDFYDKYLVFFVVAIVIIILLLFYIKVISNQSHGSSQNNNQKLFIDKQDIKDKIEQRKK